MQNDFFKWDEAFETGIYRIDIQHKVLVKILNELYDIFLGNKGATSIDKVIQELVQYTIYHFGEEEKLFDKYNFSETKDHKQEHQKFIDKINIIIKNINEKDIVAMDLLNFLKDRLVDHIMVTDKKYVAFFNEKNIQIN